MPRAKAKAAVASARKKIAGAKKKKKPLKAHRLASAYGATKRAPKKRKPARRVAKPY